MTFIPGKPRKPEFIIPGDDRTDLLHSKNGVRIGVASKELIDPVMKITPETFQARVDALKSVIDELKTHKPSANLVSTGDAVRLAQQYGFDAVQAALDNEMFYLG